MMLGSQSLKVLIYAIYCWNNVDEWLEITWQGKFMGADDWENIQSLSLFMVLIGMFKQVAL